jgi:exopolysaccharide production protein ExoY
MYYAHNAIVQDNNTAEAYPKLAPYVNSWVKRLFDCVAAGIGLVVLSPFLAFVFLLVKLEGGGDALFRHTRVGRNGHAFKCLKFRTMVQDADVRLAELLKDPVIAAEWRETQKLKKDPRITKIGGFLRKTSLDELPQLWNIFVGEMSLVGPRPVTTPELARYGNAVAAYLSVRPGLTGPWQIGGRSDTTFEKRVGMDHQYAISATFANDLVCILKTATVVLGDKTAA